jgi:hypothetical protein
MTAVLGVGQSEPLRVASPQFPPASNAGDEEIRPALCVPTTPVDPDIDWRLPVFEAGRYLLAFDGAALLLLELSRRKM